MVDEAQDLLRESFLIVLNSCLKKGLSRGKWTMFGDFTMQAIYTEGVSGAELIERLEEYASFVRFKLITNCRNTESICKEIETVTGFKAQTDLWSRVEGPPVQYLTWVTQEEQSDKLRELLRRLEGETIFPEQITILSPKRRTESVVSLLSGLNIREYKCPQGMNTTFCTIQGYKGLENTVVILTDIEDYLDDKLMYVGLSRARSGLFILLSETAKKEFDDLLIRRLLQ